MGLIHDVTLDALSGEKPDPSKYVRRVPDDLDPPPEDAGEYSRPPLLPREEKGPGDVT